MTLVDFAETLKSPRSARWTGGGLLSIVLLLMMATVLFTFRSQTQATTHSLRQLGMLRAQAALAPAFHKRLDELRARTAGLPGSLQAKTATLGQSQLQQTMESLVTSNGSSVRSAQMLPIIRENGFDVIAIQYDLAVPMSRLRDLSYAIESHNPYLFITDASISGGQESAGSQAQDPQLEVRWTVRAYRWEAA